jgi:hypothetical protein
MHSLRAFQDDIGPLHNRPQNDDQEKEPNQGPDSLRLALDQDMVGQVADQPGLGQGEHDGEDQEEIDPNQYQRYRQ